MRSPSSSRNVYLAKMGAHRASTASGMTVVKAMAVAAVTRGGEPIEDVGMVVTSRPGRVMRETRARARGARR
jgi:hypothetical protein